MAGKVWGGVRVRRVAAATRGQHIMRRFLILLGASIFSLPVAAQEITNFRSGLACLNSSFGSKDFGKRSICVDTEIIPITGQSVCVFNGEDRPCTWYGFEFEYKNANGVQKIICSNTSDRPGDVGGPDGISAKDVSAIEYTLELKGDSGRVFNPQYSVYRPGTQNSEEVIDKTVCRVGERKLFEFKFRIMYPATG